MKTFMRFLFFVACIGILVSCEKEEDFYSGEDLAELKAAKIKVQPSTETDALDKAKEDWKNINYALQNAKPGETVQLGKGTFYLHKSIIRLDFNGILRGSGVHKTTIQTVQGELFDVSECPQINWTFEENDGGFMFCFPHDFTEEERTVTVSDLSILVSEPTTPYIRWRNCDMHEPTEFNSLQAFNVHYTNLDNDMANPINLNVLFKNLSIKGVQDAKYNENGFSVFYGLAAYGLSNGKFEICNVQIENASVCIAPYSFYGDNAIITLKNSSLKSCGNGIYSFLNHSFTILNNKIENSQYPIVLLKQSASGELLEGPDGKSLIKNNMIHFKGALGLGIQNFNNVQIKNNVFEGSGWFGGIAGAGAITGGDNWIIKDNNLCNVVPGSYHNCTIYLNNLTNSEIRNNANQLIRGSGADEPSNIIGEGSECDD